MVGPWDLTILLTWMCKGNTIAGSEKLLDSRVRFVSEHLSLAVIPPGEDIVPFSSKLLKESAWKFKAMFIDKHHDVLSCPLDHKASWKKRLVHWASDKKMELYLLSAVAPSVIQQRLLVPIQYEAGKHCPYLVIHELAGD